MEFDAAKIQKLRLNTSAFNLRIIEKEDISNIVCKLKNVDENWVAFTEDDDTLTLSVTAKGAMIKTIWNTSSKRNIKIFVPQHKVFRSIRIGAGIGLTRLKNISCEKLNLAAGVGVSQLINVNVEQKCKIAAGVGRVMIKNSTFRDLSLNGGVGLTQFSGILCGKSSISGGIGKIELIIKADRDDYDIKTKSTFFDNIYIDGALSKNYHHENIDAEHTLRLSGGVGSIDLRFKNESADE